MGRNDAGYEILMGVKDKYSKEKIFHSLLAQYYFQKDMFEEAFKEIDEYEKIDSKNVCIHDFDNTFYRMSSTK